MRALIRRLVRQPWLSSAIVLTFCLGIGGAAAAVSGGPRLFFKPLPYAHPDRLVRIGEARVGAVAPMSGLLLGSDTWTGWQTGGSSALEGIAIDTLGQYDVRIGRESVRLLGAALSPNAFSLLGVTAALGPF